jgi:16S rRNA (guanine(966)-N(2))-methyltransferase RsmD
VRPTARRLRETLFTLLAARIEAARFLDLCAGSGAVGIEALSRGARHVTFVDRSPKVCSFIISNLKMCGVEEDQAEVWTSDAVRFLRHAATAASGIEPWELTFYDPPYNTDYEPLLKLCGTVALLKPRRGVLVVEHHCEYRLSDRVEGLRRWRSVRQGDSCLSFYERR